MQSNVKITPMVQQYLEIKGQFLDALLLFRLGDFYEAFFDDAKLVSKTLQLVLTARNGIPMAGIPYHALDNYLKRLVEAGFKVAICDQMEDSALAKGIVRREVTRVVTPGTVIEENLVDMNSSNFLAAVWEDKDFFACLLDISTGESYVFVRNSWEQIVDLFQKRGITQLLVPEQQEWDLRSAPLKKRMPALFVEKLPDWYFHKEEAREQIKRFFKVSYLDYLELPTSAQTLYGAVLKYLENQYMTAVDHFRPPILVRDHTTLWMDFATIDHLNLIHRESGSAGTSLYDILNETATPMGSRLLKQWILFPLREVSEIEKRLDRIDALLAKPAKMESLKEILAGYFDLERIASRISYGKVNPKDLAGLRQSLFDITLLNEILTEYKDPKQVLPRPEGLPDLQNLLETAIKETPSRAVGEGEVIGEGFDPELDEIRELYLHSDNALRALEFQERERTGIGSLKVSYNSVFGYYIEVPKSQTSRVPPDYERRQTLVASERYMSPALKPLEEKLLNARERLAFLEKRAYLRLIELLKPFIPKIQAISERVAVLDVACALAFCALKRRFKRPSFSPDRILEIHQGRHPVIEQNQDFFIPNDLRLDKDHRFVILTGPNMAGKSTFLRQAAVIVVMAQMGCFVPVESAKVPIFDRIFTRIGARDDLSSGKSTFLVEMTETAAILNNATDRSLIILDEIGRGTSTYDGISIAWVVSEYILNAIGAYCVFATHYNELTELGSLYPGIHNFRIKVTEENGEVLFLYKVEEGAADRSYGIEVARIAGLPPEVIARANQVLETITAENRLESKVRVLGSSELEKMKQKLSRSKRVIRNQMSFFDKEDFST